jgi:hypothetical protein
MGPPRGDGEDAQPVDAQLLVDPAVIDFGIFEFPEDPDDPQFLTSTFSVYNASLQSMYLQGQGDVIGSKAFTVQGAPGPDTLAGHEVVEYTVVFQPVVDDLYEGQISLNLGDAVVEIYGEAHAPRLEVEEAIQISTPYRCVQEHSLRVQNIGHEPLTLDPNDFSAEGPQYGLSWEREEPLELLPGAVDGLLLMFAPTDDQVGVEHLIEARIGTNEPGDPIRTIAISATAIAVEDTVESFRFDTDLQSSLLIVPDTRAAMATTLEAFAAAAESLVTAIANKNDNGVQVAVVGGWHDGAPCPTTERPFYDTRVDKLPDIAAALADGLTAAGAGTGNLLELMQGAVYEMGEGHCLDGFLRPGTSLHVLLLSNGAEDSKNDPSTYARAILNEVTGTLGGTGAEISVFVPGGQDCSDDGCTRLIAASEYEDTHGSVWDLSTSDWDEALDAYGVSLVPPRGDIPLILSQAAHQTSEDVADIVLTVQGETEPIESDYYEYNSGLQAVMLDMAAPIPAGALVHVAYLPAAACE